MTPEYKAWFQHSAVKVNTRTGVLTFSWYHAILDIVEIRRCPQPAVRSSDSSPTVANIRHSPLPKQKAGEERRNSMFAMKTKTHLLKVISAGMASHMSQFSKQMWVPYTLECVQCCYTIVVCPNVSERAWIHFVPTRHVSTLMNGAFAGSFPEQQSDKAASRAQVEISLEQCTTMVSSWDALCIQLDFQGLGLAA